MSINIYKTTERALFLIFILSLCLISSFVAVKTTYIDIIVIKRNECKTALVQRVLKKKKSEYLIEIAYENNGSIVNRTVYVKKHLNDIFSNGIDFKYQIGNKIMVLVCEKEILLYHEIRSRILRDIFYCLFNITCSIFCIYFMLKMNVVSQNTRCYKTSDISSILNSFAILSFIIGFGLYFIRNDLSISYLFFTNSLLLISVVGIFIEKKIQIRSICISYKKEPEIFVLVSIVNLLLLVLSIYMSVNEVKKIIEKI